MEVKEKETTPPHQDAPLSEVEATTSPHQTVISSANKAVAVREKDIKKVTAGRAGAASRKASQERLIAELRSAKDALHISAEALSKRSEAPVTDITKDAVPPPLKDINTNKPTMSNASWGSWIVGGALVAAVLLLRRTGSGVDSRQEVRREKTPVKACIDTPPPCCSAIKG